MNSEQKSYVKAYLIFYLCFVVFVIAMWIIGTLFFNQGNFGFVWILVFVSVGMLISFILKMRNFRKRKENQKK